MQMLIRKALAAALPTLFIAIIATPAFAGAEHEHKPRHGGVVQEVKDIQYELVARADQLALYVEDHGKKVATQGGSAKLTLLNGSEKAEASLTAAGDNKLEARGTFKIAKGTKVVAVVNLPGKPAQSVRFVLP